MHLTRRGLLAAATATAALSGGRRARAQRPIVAPSARSSGSA